MSRNNRVTHPTSDVCLYHKQDKKCRLRKNVKKTNIFIVKTIASGTTNQEGRYKQRS